MTGRPSCDTGFNRIPATFRDDLSRPDYRAKCEALTAIVARLARFSLPVRLDFAREWENAHVLLELDRLRASAPIGTVLEVGGGNSPICYYLADQGFDVSVLDVDRRVVARVDEHSRILGWAGRLRGCHHDGRGWPFGDAQFDCVVSISVFEGILRHQRPLFWSEMRRVMKPGASLLLTFDYGEGGRLVADPPTSVREIDEQIIRPSGMTLVGNDVSEPRFDPDHGPPVKIVVPTLDGFDYRVAAFGRAALHLRKPVA
jgi:SAM-dependent methyltransferase